MCEFEFETSYRAMLRTHDQAGAESVVSYAACTTDVCSKASAGLSTETQLLLTADYFLTGFANSTSRDYLLNDRACRPLTWQEVVQITQACEASRILLHAPSTVADAVSAMGGAPSLDDRMCEPANSVAASAWQQKSARDGSVKAGAH